MKQDDTLTNKECEVCGKSFSYRKKLLRRHPTKKESYYYRTYNRKHCSVSCTKAKYRTNNLEKHNETNTKWRKSNPNYLREYYRKHCDPKKLEPDYSMLGRSAVHKGRILENFVAEELRKSGLDVRARRTFGSGGGIEKGDINNSLGLNIECKNTKRLDFKNAWKQCQRDAGMSHTEPVLIWHPPQESLEGSVVFMRVNYFAELLTGLNDIKPLDNPKVKYPLLRLKNAISEVLKELE